MRAGSTDSTRTGPPTVLIVGPTAPPVGGIANCVQQILDAEFSVPLRIEHVNTAKPSNARTTKLRLVLAAGATIARVAMRVARPHVALVHIHTSSYGGFYEKAVMAMIARALGKRTILHIHGGGFEAFYEDSSPFARRCMRLALKRCTAVVSLSRRTKSFLVRAVRLRGESIVIVPNGVTIPRVARSRPLQREHFTVLTIGHLATHKGVGELIDAAYAIAAEHRDVRFVHVGPALDEAESVKWRERAEDLVETGSWRWHGEIAPSECWDYLACADLFVLPSHAEGLPLALLEAMASGLPVVASAVGAVPEVVRHGRNGLLIPAKDATALAAAIHLLVADPALRARLGGQARVDAERKFSLSATIAALSALYQKSLK